MSKNLNGELESAIPDTCKGYNPIPSKPAGVWSEKSGLLYKCRNWANDRVLVSGVPAYGNLEGACLYCDNWQTPDGEYKNMPPEEVAIAFYKKNSDKFIEYFPKQTALSKKMILKEIFKCDFVNEEVIRWLDKEESELVREVGLSLV
jgi:hypothetical protein